MGGDHVITTDLGHGGIISAGAGAGACAVRVTGGVARRIRRHPQALAADALIALCMPATPARSAEVGRIARERPAVAQRKRLAWCRSTCKLNIDLLGRGTSRCWTDGHWALMSVRAQCPRAAAPAAVVNETQPVSFLFLEAARQCARRRDSSRHQIRLRTGTRQDHEHGLAWWDALVGWRTRGYRCWDTATPSVASARWASSDHLPRLRSAAFRPALTWRCGRGCTVPHIMAQGTFRRHWCPEPFSTAADIDLLARALAEIAS